MMPLGIEIILCPPWLNKSFVLISKLSWRKHFSNLGLDSLFAFDSTHWYYLSKPYEFWSSCINNCEFKLFKFNCLIHDFFLRYSQNESLKFYVLFKEENFLVLRVLDWILEYE